MKKEVFAYLETHWDREWYKTFEEYRLRLSAVVEDILQKIENNEINCFYMDGQTAMLDDYLEIFPQKKEYIQNLIKNKKLFVGPFYTLADEFLVSGESLCRNLLIGYNEAVKYGADTKDFIGYLPDAFGHSGWMPLILKKADIKKALVWRGLYNAKQEFSWASPNGESIKTAFLAGGYYQDFFAHKSYKKLLNKHLETLEKYTTDGMPILLPIGADHLACEDKIKAKIKNFNRDNKKFHIKLSSLKEYFETTKANKTLKITSGELRDNRNNYLLPSVASSRIYLKQKNIYLEWLLTKIAEPLYAICISKNLIKSKKEYFDYIWKLLIQNHAHDSICGCCLDDVHTENMTRYNKIEQVCNNLLELVRYNIQSKIAKDNICIFNLSNFDYSGVISFYSHKKLPLTCISKHKSFPNYISQNIHNIPVQENYNYIYEYLINVKEIKANSCNILKPQNTTTANLSYSNNHLENQFLSIDINKDGTLNIKDKATNKTFHNILKITDEADVGDSYNFSCIPNDTPIIATFKGYTIKISNELRKTLKLTYELYIPSHAKSQNERSHKKIKHTFNVYLTLDDYSKRLNIKIDYENLSKDHIIKLNFELENPITKVTSEDTFGVIHRNFNPEYNYKEHLPKAIYQEVDLNTGIFQRFVSTQGLCIITKGLQEYEVYKNNLNITLLRSFEVIAKKTLLTRTAAAGPPLPTPEGQCLGKQHAEFSILLSDNNNDFFKEADSFYNPFFVVDGISETTTLNTYTYLNLSEDLYLYNLKEAEDKNGIIAKILNYSYNQQKLIINNKAKVLEVNLLEKPINDNNLINQEIIFNAGELKILHII